MKIILLESIGVDDDALAEYAQELKSKGHKLIYSENPVVSEADIIVVSTMSITGSFVKSYPKLKMISIAFTGYDHVDIEACRERSIVVCNASGYANTAVAELVFGCITAMYRQLVWCDSQVRNCSDRRGTLGKEIQGKVLGVVGTGAIGKSVINLGKAYGCRILGYNVPEESIPGVENVEFDRLLKQSDIVTLHVPLNERTEHMIDATSFKMMKKSAILVNASRGPVVDTDALADALEQKQIAGACIDVFDMGPPLPKGHKLLSAPNTLLTPHIGYATEEAMRKRADIVFENIMAYLENRIQNRVG